MDINTENPLALRTHTEMVGVLMNPNALGPEVHYYMIRGGSDKKNLTVWQNGLVGEEYIKTYGHYHISDFLETYTVLSGEGMILLQVRKLDESGNPIDDEIDSFKAIFVRPGSVVRIPKRSGHLALNIGKSWLVTSDDSPVNFKKNTETDEAAWPLHADYEPVRKMKGFAYYVIEKDGQPFFIKNSNYNKVPVVEISDA